MLSPRTATAFGAIDPPETEAEVKAICRAGARNVKGAAVWLGISRSEVSLMVSRGEVWSFKRGRRRLIPVVELRRYLAAVAMEEVAR